MENAELENDGTHIEVGKTTVPRRKRSGRDDLSPSPVIFPTLLFGRRFPVLHLQHP